MFFNNPFKIYSVGKVLLTLDRSTRRPMLLDNPKSRGPFKLQSIVSFQKLVPLSKLDSSFEAIVTPTSSYKASSRGVAGSWGMYGVGCFFLNYLLSIFLYLQLTAVSFLLFLIRPALEQREGEGSGRVLI